MRSNELLIDHDDDLFNDVFDFFGEIRRHAESEVAGYERGVEGKGGQLLEFHKLYLFLLVCLHEQRISKYLLYSIHIITVNEIDRLFRV